MVQAQLETSSAGATGGVLWLDRAGDRETVGVYLRRWLAGRRGTIEETSWRNHERHVGLHLEPAIGGPRLSRLTADHLRALHGRLQHPGGHSPKSVREVHGTVRQALQQATDDGLLLRNVALLVKLPKLPQRSRQYVLAPEQLRRFWATAESDRLNALWRLAALVPSRSGSCAGALGGRGRAQPAARHPTHPAELRRRRSGRADQGAQDGRRTRLIDLDDELLDALRRHRDRQEAERRALGPAWVDHGLVFCSRWGTPLLSGNELRRFRQLLGRAGPPTHHRVQDLRHTAVSSLLVAGVPLAEVAQLAGHASPQITSLLYAHAIRRSKRAPATAELARFYREEAGGLPPEGAPAKVERADGTDRANRADAYGWGLWAPCGMTGRRVPPGAARTERNERERRAGPGGVFRGSAPRRVAGGLPGAARRGGALLEEGLPDEDSNLEPTG